jgi:hypothetical protein
MTENYKYHPVADKLVDKWDDNLSVGWEFGHYDLIILKMAISEEFKKLEKDRAALQKKLDDMRGLAGDLVKEIKRKHELEMDEFTELQNTQHWDYIGQCQSCLVVKKAEAVLGGEK